MSMSVMALTDMIVYKYKTLDINKIYVKFKNMSD